MPRVRQIGQVAAMHPAQLLMDLVKDNENAYDGAAFFGNTRTIGKSGNIDNLVAGTGSTLDNITADLENVTGPDVAVPGRPGAAAERHAAAHHVLPHASRSVLARAQSDAGRRGPVSARPFSTDGGFKASGYTVMPNPYLTDVNDWYAFHIGGPAYRPFVFQVEQAPMMEGATSTILRKRSSKGGICTRSMVGTRWG